MRLPVEMRPDVILIKYYYFISTSLNYHFCGTKAVTAFDCTCVNCNKQQVVVLVAFRCGIDALVEEGDVLINGRAGSGTLGRIHA
jgi:hypothetical protein